MTSTTLKMWRAITRLSQEDAAEKLGIRRRQYQYFEAGAKPIPRAIGLACAAIFAGLDEWMEVDKPPARQGRA